MIIPRYSKKKHQIKAFTGTSGYEKRGGSRLHNIKMLNYNEVQIKFNAGNNLQVMNWSKK